MGPYEMFFALGDAVTTVSKYDEASGRWLSWIPGAPATVNSLTTINPGDVLWTQVGGGYGDVSLDFMEAPAEGSAHAALLAATDAVTYAMRERDQSRLHLASCDGNADCAQGQAQTQQQVQAREHQRQQLAACVPGGADFNVIGRTITIAADGQTAAVQLRLGIHSATGPQQVVTQQWTFQQTAQGAWLMTNVPPCPFS